MVRELEGVDAGSTLSLEAWGEIAQGIASGRSLTGIARGVGRPASTVSLEVTRNGGRGRYLAVFAERTPRRRVRRPKARRLAVDRTLALEASDGCGCGTRPTKLAKRLRLENPESALVSVPSDVLPGALPAGPWRGESRGGLRADDLCVAHRSSAPLPHGP
jgi:hypothetical protein